VHNWSELTCKPHCRKEANFACSYYRRKGCTPVRVRMSKYQQRKQANPVPVKQLDAPGRPKPCAAQLRPAQGLREETTKPNSNDWILANTRRAFCPQAKRHTVLQGSVLSMLRLSRCERIFKDYFDMD
jgi:hypothetical protein